MKAAIIGCGTMGAIHAQMAANCGLDIVVCSDPVRARATALARGYQAEALTDTMAAARHEDVDVVVVASPTPTHAGHVIAAARSGKHVFCEKPLARTAEQAGKALAAAQKNGVKLFVGHVLRYFHAFEALKAQVDAGKIGPVGFIKTYRGGVCPRGAKNWYRDFDQSGGAVLDLLIHDFDWIRYAFGPPERVFCQNLHRSKPRTLDYAMATLTLKSGVIAQIIGSWAHPEGFRVKVELCGEGGIIQYDSDEAPITAMKRTPSGPSPSVIVPSSPVTKSPYQLEWEDFLAWIQDGRTPRVTADDALAALRTGLAALKSAETGRAVKL